MKAWMRRCHATFTDGDFLLRTVNASLFLLVGITLNFLAAQYAFDEKSNYVTDIVLSNTPVFDVDAFFVYGPVLFWLFMAYLIFFEPKRLPFTIKTVALLTITRSIFVSLTHLGPFPNHLLLQSSWLTKFTLGADLFFSGHTAFPFLMALIFWENKFLRYLFIVSSIFFGCIVLLAHLHYSIDVLSAFFIAYGVYKIAERIFRQDREIFYDGAGAPLS